MLDCRYQQCPHYMIKLSGKLRQINGATCGNEDLQNEIDQLLKKLDAHGHAYNIAHVLHQDILGASTTRFIPLLQCVAKSVTTLSGNVLSCFEHWLPDSLEDIFEVLCEKNDVKTKKDLLLLRKEWGYSFSLDTLTDIDDRLHRLDSDWSISPTVRTSSLTDQPKTSTSTNSLPLRSSEPLSSLQPSRELLPKDNPSSQQLQRGAQVTNSKHIAKERCKKFSHQRFQTLHRSSDGAGRPITATRPRLSSVGSSSVSSNSDKENDSSEFVAFLTF